MTAAQFNHAVRVAIAAKLAWAQAELSAIETYAKACNVDANDMADAILSDPFAAQQFEDWKRETWRA